MKYLPSLLCCSFFTLVILSGCASSERMTRTSAGVFDEYSAPRSHRIRSKKFQKGSSSIGKPRDHISGLHGDAGSIVNLWPFFYANQNYVSALWPIFDCDPYGWAIRPLYNQEGDDHSILFPLISWNTSDSDGWILNFVFAPKYFGFVPITYHGWSDNSTTFWYTPLLIHTDSRNSSPSLRRPHVSDSFTELCLFYAGKKTSMKAPVKHQFLNQYPWNMERFFREKKNVIRYQFHKIGEPMPANYENFTKAVDNLFKKYYKEDAENYGGFFPLFHISSKKDLTTFNMLWLLRTEQSPDYFKCSVIGSLIGQYSNRKKAENAPGCSWGTDFSSICLLSSFKKKNFYRSSPADKILAALKTSSYENGFAVRSKSTLEELRKIHPDTVKKMPKTVADGETFRMYLNELSLDLKRETGCDKSGGCLPLFYCNATDNGAFSWFSLPLLSFYQSDNNGKYGLFLPLLSGFSTSKEKDSFVFLATLGSFCTVNRTAPEKRYRLPISSADTKWLGKANWAKQKYEDQYYCLGLFFRGKDYFYVAKKGLKDNPEHLKKNITQAIRKYQTIQTLEKQLARREQRNKERIIKTKIDHYYQLIEEEKIRLEREKCKNDLVQLESFAAGVLKTAKKLNFALAADFYKDSKNIEIIGNRIMDELAELRGSEDFGNGIVFRKENYYNGNYNWKFFGFLAGGEKSGKYEKTHILHLLYRNTRQNDKEETLCFPFIVKGRDGKNTHFSFMWRVFSIETKDDRTSGHILFIPYKFN